MKRNEVYFEPPRKHWDILQCSLGNFKSRKNVEKKALEFMKRIEKNSLIGAYIYGGFGNGKTHLLVGTARKLKAQDVNIAYVTGTGREIWDLVHDGTYNFKQDNPLSKAKILIIDDLDLEHDSLWQSELFYKLLLEQDRSGNPLLISSNHSPENLVRKIKIKEGDNIVKGGMDTKVLTKYGEDREMQERILDRLRDMCLFIDFSKVPSRREEQQKKYQKMFLE